VTPGTGAAHRLREGDLLMRRLVLRALSIAAAAALVVAGATVAQAAPTALNAQDRSYLQGAHQSNLAEIATGKLAQTKGSSKAVKELGMMLVADHTKLDAALRKVAAAKQVSLPSAPNAEQRAMQAKLAAASGADFDAMFVSGQIVGHAKTMALGMKEAKAGQDPTVKKAAAAAAPVVAEHHDKFVAQADAMGLPAAVDAGRSPAAMATTPGTARLAVPLIAGGVILTLAGLVLLRRRHAGA
jgi:putative membrane protein